MPPSPPVMTTQPSCGSVAATPAVASVRGTNLGARGVPSASTRYWPSMWPRVAASVSAAFGASASMSAQAQETRGSSCGRHSSGPSVSACSGPPSMTAVTRRRRREAVRHSSRSRSQRLHGASPGAGRYTMWSMPARAISPASSRRPGSSAGSARERRARGARTLWIAPSLRPSSRIVPARSAVALDRSSGSHFRPYSLGALVSDDASDGVSGCLSEVVGRRARNVRSFSSASTLPAGSAMTQRAVMSPGSRRVTVARALKDAGSGRNSRAVPQPAGT